MAKNGEAAAKPAAGQGAGLALAILLGGGLGVLLLLLLTLLIRCGAVCSGRRAGRCEEGEWRFLSARLRGRGADLLGAGPSLPCHVWDGWFS